MELDDDSPDLTTFMTPFGRYKFLCVPFGSSAPEMFQRKIIQIFVDIPGVIVYFDDLAVIANDIAEHDRTLSLVIKRTRNNNAKLNPDMLQYRQSKVNFMGHCISNGSIRANEK